MFCIVLLRVYLLEFTRKHLPFHQNLSKNNSPLSNNARNVCIFPKPHSWNTFVVHCLSWKNHYLKIKLIWGKLLEHKSYDNLPLHAHLCSISAANLWETISIFKRTEVSLCLLNFYIKILHTYYRSFERNRKIGMQRKDYSAYIITIHVGIFL